MTEQELRALVREAIARQTGRTAGAPLGAGATLVRADQAFATVRQHPSHGLCAVPAGADSDGPCVIEPAVPCNHCGYCKSYGH